MERIGEVLVSCLALIFSDFNPQGITVWEFWLLAACGGGNDAGTGFFMSWYIWQESLPGPCCGGSWDWPHWNTFVSQEGCLKLSS